MNARGESETPSFSCSLWVADVTETDRTEKDDVREVINNPIADNIIINNNIYVCVY